MNFRTKAILGITLIELIFLSLLLWVSLSYLKETNERQLLQRGQATANLIAAAATDAVIARDLATLQRIVDDSVKTSLIGHLQVLSAEGVSLAAGGVPEYGKNKELVLDVSASIVVAGKAFGQVQIQISALEIIEMLAHVRSDLLAIALAEMLLTALVSFLLGTWLLRGLGRIQDGVERFSRGELVQLPESKDDLGRLAGSFNRMVHSLLAQTERAEHFRERSQMDVLTGLSNRERLLDDLNSRMHEAKEGNALLAVVYLDLDRFKFINDRYGHVVGDMVLKIVAGRLRKGIRGHDWLYRVGGDEFVLLLSGLENIEDCEVLLLRMLGLIREPLQVERGPQLEIDASMGVTFYPLGTAEDAHTLLDQADRAMYAAKLGEKPHLRMFEASMQMRSPITPIETR